MLKITKKILKKLVEFKVARSIPGRMRLKSNAPYNIYHQARDYDEYFKKAVLLLPGIEEIDINYNIGSALIQYDIEKTYESKVLEWINTIIDIGIRNEDTIAEYYDVDVEYLEKVLELQLREELEKL